MKKLKIGLVLDDSLDVPDGVQQYVLTLGTWLSEQGHSVHYLVGNTERVDIPNVHSLSKNVRVHFNQNRMSIPLPADKSAIEDLLHTVHFDVLHIQMYYSPLLAGRIINGAPKRTAIVGTFHIVLASKFSEILSRSARFVLRRSLSRFSEIVSVSQPAARLAKTSMGLDSTVVPNAVNLRTMRTGRKIKKYNDEIVTIVFLGRLVERKGAGLLLDAVGQLKRTDNIRVIICGDGPLRSQLELQAESLGISKIVEFTGFLDEKDKPHYLASADIAVFPSTGGESFGIVLVEAMAARAGVVLAGQNPGYATVMEGKSDVLVDPRDAHVFAKKLQNLIDDPEKRTELHDWQQQIVQQYDVTIVGQQILAMYDRALHDKS